MLLSQTTLIRSKLMVPHVAGLLHRPRVCEAIACGLERKLTLIAAPAGYGKTAALVDFAQGCRLPVCWYTADERDRDAGLFVAYLVGAIAERFPGFGGHVSALLASETGAVSRDPAGAAEVLAAEILDLKAPFVLVIDNYEPVDDMPGVRRFLDRLLDVLPAGCHLAMGSRVVPGISSSHLEEGDGVVRLEASDLSFTSQEIQALLGMVGVEVTEEQAGEIGSDSEGWVTAVLLASLSGEDVGQALVGGAGMPGMYEYLAAEVLERQTFEVRAFLLESSVLREVSAGMCGAVLEVRNAGGLLREVERRNLFVTRFGEGRRATYRYHNLFRGFLERQLEARAGDRHVELHLRAAGCYDGVDDVEGAVHHYLAAGAYEEAIPLMERVAREWYTRGRGDMLLEWAEALPDTARVKAPRLLLYQTRVLSDRHDFDAARQVLADTEAGLIAAGLYADKEAEVWLLRAQISLFEGRYENALVEAQRVFEIADEGTLDGVHSQRCIGRAYIGLGRVDEGLAMLQEARSSYRELNSPYDVVNTQLDMDSGLAELGDIDEIARCLVEALAVARRLGAPTLIAGILNDLGYTRYLRGEYREALALFEEGLSVARFGGDTKWQAYTAVGIADLYRDYGSYERAESLYNLGWQLASEADPSLAVYVLVARSCMWRWQGDFERALVSLRQARQLAEERDLGFGLQGQLPVAEGITLAESGEVEAGLDMISIGIAFLEQRQARCELVRAYFLLSKARYLAGDEVGCLAALRDAFRLAQEAGMDQPIVAEGQHAEDLLRLGVTRGVAVCRGVIQKARELRELDLESVEDGDGLDEAHLRVYALGGGQVVLGGRTLTSTDWRAAMARELFFYILLSGPVEREEIGGLFWPGVAAKKMNSSFHTTLHRVRRAVGAKAVVMEDGAYRVGDVTYWFDVGEFETLVGRARPLSPEDWEAEDLWRRALVLYRGDFLPEVDGEWCVSKRERLREMHVDALVGVGRCREVRGDYEGSLEWYGRALEVDDLREDVHRRVMECYDRAGQRTKALRQYRRCCEVLDRELGIAPSSEMVQAYERIAGTGERESND